MPQTYFKPSKSYHYMEKIKFCIVTLSSIIPSLSQNDWFTALNIKNAFFHLAIHQCHRKFLCFFIENVHYPSPSCPGSRFFHLVRPWLSELSHNIDGSRTLEGQSSHGPISRWLVGPWTFQPAGRKVLGYSIPWVCWSTKTNQLLPPCTKDQMYRIFYSKFFTLSQGELTCVKPGFKQSMTFAKNSRFIPVQK